MKCSKRMKLVSAILVCCVMKVGLTDGDLSNVNSSITIHANDQLVNAIDLPLPFVVSDWAMLSKYYSQNSTFAPADIYDVDTSTLSGVTGVAAITNTSSGTLEVRYGPNAPGPMANNGYALAPTRESLRGNTFHVYELPICFTNIEDSQSSLSAPKPGTPIGVFGDSNLGTNCYYATDPYSTAIAEVQGTVSLPTRMNGASS